MAKSKINPLCEYLNCDDELKGEITPFQNQKMLLESYADEHGHSNCVPQGAYNILQQIDSFAKEAQT